MVIESLWVEYDTLTLFDGRGSLKKNLTHLHITKQLHHLFLEWSDQSAGARGGQPYLQNGLRVVVLAERENI